MQGRKLTSKEVRAEIIGVGLLMAFLFLAVFAVRSAVAFYR